MKELLERLSAAIEAGTVSEQEVEDLMSRGRQRRKQATLDRVGKRLDEGMSEEELMTALEKKK